MVEQIEENPDIPVKAVQEQFQRKYVVGVSRMKAYRAKTKARKMVEGDYSSQYGLLRDYVLELQSKNPGTTVKIDLEPGHPRDLTRQFRRIYVCLGALKQGFKALGRDLLGLDGAFMKGPYPGQLLSAVGVDSNNGIYPVCYAIVEAENLSAWTWFLDLLADDLEIPRNSAFTFMSDRQKGLLPAVSKLFPLAEHRYCLRHIHENMKGSFKGRALSDILLNNMCETFNGKILEGRDKPIIAALEYIREYLMRRIVTVLRVIERTEGLITPWAQKQLQTIKKDQPFIMCSGMEGICMPCRHVVAAIWFMATNGQRVGALESWFDPVYSIGRWKEVYAFKINPINGKALWPKSEVPFKITPPKHHKQVGRPKKVRKRSAVEMEDEGSSKKKGRLSKKNMKGVCGKCGNTGHNRRTCKGQGEKRKD
ncbi:uncharacterized protein LOC110943709 [Helianthus annuus]|uniref:uncharacterized protein LOC110943709 n=1 Tax=Helianthus annuus TaxID=4232 RepID=UPI000B906FFE|nr:uncharacterized protein LOC110943709 [Helianthus annuus]